MKTLFLRALLAFLLLPGMVAFVVPLFLLAPAGFRHFSYSLGGFPLALGIVLLCWCVREFYVSGRGTLAPWEPPRSLVVSGPYRWSRNPMYVGVLLILSGWALGYRSLSLAIYAAAIAIAFQLRIVYYEEPFLARTQSDTWQGYKSRVPRWLRVR